MPLLFTRPTFLDQDTMVIYRLAESVRDTRGNYGANWVVISTGNMVNHHGTHNFDERILSRLPAIMKKQNIMTSDVITCDIAIDVRAQDVVKITQRTTGKIYWLTVNGVADDRPLTSYTTFYGTPTPAVA